MSEDTPSYGGRNAEEARAVLQAYRDQIAEIVSMIPNGTYLVRGAGDRAREAASHLKAAVKADYKRPASSRRELSPRPALDRTAFKRTAARRSSPLDCCGAARELAYRV